jgi:transketolase
MRRTERTCRNRQGRPVPADKRAHRSACDRDGSEVALAADAAKALTESDGACAWCRCPYRPVRKQPKPYRDSVLPPGVPRVAIEAGVRDGWWRYVGLDGAVIGMTSFGASGPAKPLFEHFGFTRDNVIRTVEGLL